MALEISPKDKAAILDIWSVAGPFLRGSLTSFITAFSNHPDMMFTGADVARIAQMSLDEIEKALGVDKETTKNES